MAGDYSRLTFQAHKHFAGVLLQQGRVQIDADWNEAEAIRDHRFRLLVRDLLGPAAFVGTGFALSANGEKLTIGGGHAWIEGLLCELSSDIDAGAQPDLPLSSLPADVGAYLCVLEVWQREVTAFEDETLRDPALGGPDTTVRLTTVTQVRLRPTHPRDRRGTDRTVPTVATDGTLGVRGQYQGLEDRLYRIEIHDDGGTPTFKWSRDNGSTVAAVRSWTRNDLELVREEPRLERGNLLEIIDRPSMLERRAGPFVEVAEARVKRVALSQRSQVLPDHLVQPLARRWDGWPTPIPADGDHGIALDAGIEIHFAGSRYRSGDYWLIAVRTADGSMTWPDATDARFAAPRPPHGVEVHRSPIALVRRDASGWTVLRDLRNQLRR